MGFNRLGIYYIHWEQHDFIWRSIVSQVDFVDYIFVLDSSLEKKALNLPDYCKHKVEVEHTHKFGSGFDNQYGLGYFEQVEARNYGIQKVFENCDFMFAQDSDEFFSPEAFFWARTVKDAILNLPEIVWRTEDAFSISPHRHIKGGSKSTGIKHVPNPNVKWLNEGSFHRSRHGVYRWNRGNVHQLDKAWHNHLHYMYWPMGKNIELHKINVGDTNFLYNGIFPSSYNDFIDKRKEDHTYAKRSDS